jgi:hypothetical protein
LTVRVVVPLKIAALSLALLALCCEGSSTTERRPAGGGAVGGSNYAGAGASAGGTSSGGASSGGTNGAGGASSGGSANGGSANGGSSTPGTGGAGSGGEDDGGAGAGAMTVAWVARQVRPARVRVDLVVLVQAAPPVPAGGAASRTMAVATSARTTASP